MQLVTLITDWGSKDFFAGMVKGRLHTFIPECHVVDITHDIKPFSIPDAVFVAKAACGLFPENTIHIIDVNSYESKTESHIVIKNNGHYFICTDNGIPYGIFGETFEEAYMIDVRQDSNFYTFASLDIFSKVAGMIFNKVPLNKIGAPLQELNFSQLRNDTYTKNTLNASVMYTDAYGNAYLNLTYERFEEMRNSRRFSVRLTFSKNIGVHKISTSYDDVPPDGHALLTVSATGLMQIAINRGSAEKLLGLRVDEVVTFEFED